MCLDKNTKKCMHGLPKNAFSQIVIMLLPWIDPDQETQIGNKTPVWLGPDLVVRYWPRNGNFLQGWLSASPFCRLTLSIGFRALCPFWVSTPILAQAWFSVSLQTTARPGNFYTGRSGNELLKIIT